MMLLPWLTATTWAHGDLVGYHTPSAMEFQLDLLSVVYPDLVTRIDFGYSVGGAQLAGVIVTATDTPRTHWRVIGAHHGDEANSGEVALSIAQWLAEDYALDANVAAILETDAVWVIPHLNPDGVSNADHTNLHGVDLNHNYGVEWSEAETDPGDMAFSEQECRAVRTTSQLVNYGAGLSMHSGSTEINWPWNHTIVASEDASLMEQMATAYVDGFDTEGFTGSAGSDVETTNGTFVDWSYGRFGVLDFRVGVDDDLYTESDLLDDLSEAHWLAFLEFAGWSDMLSGQVLDAATGLPIQSVITVVEGGQSFISGVDGRFSRPSQAGGWTLDVSSAGYATQTLSATTEASLEVLMVVADRGSIRPDPVVLSRGSEGSFTLPVEAESVTLLRPGSEDVVASYDGESWQVDLDPVSAGPWDLEVDGWTSPRAIFVGEYDDAIVIQDVSIDEAQLTITGENMMVGTQVWAIWGEARAMVSLDVIEEDRELVLVDATGLDEATSAVDLLVVTGGQQLAVTDILGDVGVDTAAPTDSGLAKDSGEDFDPVIPDFEDSEASRCGCSAAPPGAVGWVVGLLVLAGARRRRHRRD